MRARIRPALTAVALLAATFAGAGLAEAKCKRMGFLVNDYGKDGPAKDAQDLLDKHVEKWAAENGITNYTIGKKDVSCELYLNLIIFDEHTCTASANVCWDEPGAKKKDTSASSSQKKDDSASKSAASNKSDDSATKAAESDKADDSASKAAESDKAEAEAVKAADAPKSDKSPAAVETGAVPEAPAANETAAKPAVDPDAAERAAAAAERAAEAAERAAAAAERAADAAKAKAAVPSQMEMPSFGAGNAATATPSAPAAPAAVEPVKPANPSP